MSDYSEALRKAYEAQQGLYKQFTARNESLLREILVEGEDFYTIEARTKDLDSFEAKVDLPEKEQKYSNISEVTDLSGIRIICYLDEDAERVCERLSKIYEIDQENSVNKNEQLRIDQFGYRSRHYVVKFTADRANLPDFKRFADLKAEIQVRTILQHAWAAMDWKLRYKNSAEVPQDLRRRVFRVSALLELADDEFSSLSKSVDELRRDYKSKLDEGNFEIGIDRDSVDIFLSEDNDIDELVEKAVKIGFAIAPNHPRARDPYGAFIATASSARLSSVEQIKCLIADVSKKENNQIKEVFDEWKRPDRPPHLVLSRPSIARLALVLAQEKDEGLRLAKEIPFGEKLQQAVLAVLEK